MLVHRLLLLSIIFQHYCFNSSHRQHSVQNISLTLRIVHHHFSFPIAMTCQKIKIFNRMRGREECWLILYFLFIQTYTHRTHTHTHTTIYLNQIENVKIFCKLNDIHEELIDLVFTITFWLVAFAKRNFMHRNCFNRKKNIIIKHSINYMMSTWESRKCNSNTRVLVWACYFFSRFFHFFSLFVLHVLFLCVRVCVSFFRIRWTSKQHRNMSNTVSVMHAVQ